MEAILVLLGLLGVAAGVILTVTGRDRAKEGRGSGRLAAGIAILSGSGLLVVGYVVVLVLLGIGSLGTV